MKAEKTVSTNIYTRLCVHFPLQSLICLEMEVIYVDKQKLYTKNYVANTDNLWNNSSEMLVLEVFLTTVFNTLLFPSYLKTIKIRFN
jgi:hypothetical protein